MAHDLKHFIETNKIEGNIFLMGHSMGGRVAMNFLSLFPEYHDIVKGAIIIDILPNNYVDTERPIISETYELVCYNINFY